MMYLIQILPNVRRQQLDDFPKDAKRSGKGGALHVKPGTREVTEDELKHIRKHHKDVSKCLVVLRKTEAPKAKAKPAPKPSNDPPPPPAAPADDEPDADEAKESEGEPTKPGRKAPASKKKK